MIPSSSRSNMGQIFSEYFSATAVDILTSMSVALFDVFVVGATDSTPAGQSRLAATLASRHGAPETLVAKAIADKTLRVGHSLARNQADELVAQLQSVGAVTLIRPATAISAPRQSGPGIPFPMGSGAFPPPATVASGPPLASSTTLPALPTITSPTPFAAPPLPAASRSTAMQAAFAATGSGPKRDPFAPPPPVSSSRLTGSFGVREPAPAPDTHRSLPTLAGGDAFGTAPQNAGSLDLDTDSHSSAGFRPPATSASVAGASAQVLSKMVASRSGSGLSVADDAGNPFVGRCAIHDLEYDKRKASACRKCLAEKTAGMAFPDSRRRRLRENPAKRAFMGLAFALVIGLLPAAYSAVRLGGTEVQGLRARQEELSRKPGTEDIMRQFDDLDVAVEKARSRSMLNTVVLWVLVSSGAMAVWYRVT